MKNISWLKWSFIIAIITGIAMVIGATKIEAGSNLGGIIDSLGVSLLAAGLIGFPFEYYSQRNLNRMTEKSIESITQDVFKASLGSYFPDTIWEQIWRHILSVPVLRQDVRLDFQIDNHRDSGYVKLNFAWPYTLKNLRTTSTYEYPFVAAIDKSLNRDHSGEAAFSEITVDGNNLLNNGSCEFTESSGELTCKVMIPIDAGGDVKVVIRGTTVMSCEQVFPHSMSDLTENLTVSVIKPDDMSVEIDPLHPREERVEEVVTSSAEKRREWHIEGGILPGQGVNIRWFHPSGH